MQKIQITINHRHPCLLKTGFTHGDLLRWQIEYAGISLNMNGTIMRDTYTMTPELKAGHSRHIAGRELAEEFTGLIAELETDKSRAMLEACTTGETYVTEHARAFGVCAQAEWADAMRDISPALVRAFCLRLRALELNGATRPADILAEELHMHVAVQAQFYNFDMDNEPVFSQLGMHRPPLTGVDMALYKSPLKRTQLATQLAEKRKQAEG
ncbi:hypothetical protein ACUY4R_000386 [Kosakonia sp. BK9b]